MSLWKIAWRSIQQRALASSLTGFSMALGVAMVVAVLVIKGVVSQSFEEGGKSVGYHLVVGAKGGREQLVLSTIFLVSKPVENIPYSYYKKFLPDGEFGPLMAKAVPICLGDFYDEYRVVATTPAMLENFDDDPGVVHFEFAEGRNFEHRNRVFKHNGENLRGNGYFEAVLGSEVARTSGKRVGDDINPRHGADEESHEHDAFTIVGVLERTGTPSDRAVFVNMEGFFLMPDHRKPVNAHEELDKSYRKLIERHYELLEAEQAALVEKELIGAHKALLFAGDELARDDDWKREQTLMQQAQQSLASVAGQLAGNAAKKDAAEQYAAIVKDHQDLIDAHQVLIDKQAAKKAKAKTDKQQSDSADADPHAGHDHSHGRPSWRKQRPLAESQREVTAILVRTHTDDFALGIHNQVNEGQVAQAAYPIRVITEMFNLFVGPFHLVLLGLTILIVIVSGIGILVSIYNSMSDRRHEIAVMRALGAGRSTVMWVVLAESIMLSLAGGLAGWILGHGLIWAASPWIEANTGVWIGPFQMAPDIAFGENTIPMLSYELVLIPSLILLATLVGFLPALSAYRTDVAKSLTANM
jgi:putative ABC transport system permease protein